MNGASDVSDSPDGGRVRVLVYTTLQNADDDIAEYGDGSVICCIDDYTVYNEIKKEWMDSYLTATTTPIPTLLAMLTQNCENRILLSLVAGEVGVSKTSSPTIAQLPCAKAQRTK